MATINRHILAQRQLEEAEPRYETGAAVSGAQQTILNIIWTIAGVIMILLGIRFVFALLGANPANSFVNFIYTESHPFVTPFFNMFKYNVVSTGISRIEIFTIVGIVAYALIAWALTRLVTINH